VGSFNGKQDEVVMINMNGYESDIRLEAIRWDRGRVSVSLPSFDFSHLSVDAMARVNATCSLESKRIKLPLHD
jgi:hypothetical protein